MKEKILSLRNEGKSYKAISEELGISQVTVWRNLHEKINREHRAKWKKTINDRKAQAKEKLGNACSICGYSKSLRALDFHHKDQAIKLEKLKKVRDWRKLTKEEFENELKKCILVCKNCHCELHDKSFDH